MFGIKILTESKYNSMQNTIYVQAKDIADYKKNVSDLYHSKILLESEINALNEQNASLKNELQSLKDEASKKVEVKRRSKNKKTKTE